MDLLWQLIDSTLHSTTFIVTAFIVLLLAFSITFIQLLIVTVQQRKAEVVADDRAAQVLEINRRLQQTLGSIHAQVWYLDTQARVVDFNRFTREFWGIEPLQVRGRPMMAILPCWAKPATAQEENLRVLRSGKASLGVIESYAKDGYTYWVSVDRLPSFDEEGDVDGMMLFIYDITQLKVIEEALRFQKTLLEAQSETSLDGIWVVSPEGNWLSYNQRFIDLWQLSPALIEHGLVNSAYDQITSRLTDPAPFQAWINTFHHNPTCKASDILHLNDGRILDWYSTPVTGDGGQHYGRVWYFRDVTDARQTEQALRNAHAELEHRVHERTTELRQINTQLQQEIEERVRAEKALRKSEERLELALRGADLGLIDIDLQSGKTFHNERWATTHRNPLQQFPNTIVLWAESIHPDDRQDALNALEQHLSGQVPFFEHEYRIRATEGLSRWVRCRGRVVNRNDHGQPLRFSGTQMDITEYKQLEQQFLQAQKMEAVGRLAGGVAHDFNNILTVIISYSELVLLQLKHKGRLRERVEEIHKAAEKATRLTKQLLMFSRSEATSPILLDMNRLVVDIEGMLERLIGDHIQLDIHLDPSIGPIKADLGQLEQVLLNLVVNGRDAMPGGGILHVATKRLEVNRYQPPPHPDMQPGHYVKLAVTDGGCGMSAETQERIFEPFFTTKEPGQGTGLGLSTVFGIVKQNHGYIAVRSELGEGTTFCIFFPCVRGSSAQMISQVTAHIEMTGIETLLLVEDEEQIRAIASTTLRKAGYTVLTAASAEEALQISTKHSGNIHLLITDVVMPGMNGVNLSHQLMTKRPTTKVLYISGYTDGELNMYETIKDQQAFLSKPFTPTELATTVRQLLDTQTANC